MRVYSCFCFPRELWPPRVIHRLTTCQSFHDITRGKSCRPHAIVGGQRQVYEAHDFELETAQLSPRKLYVIEETAADRQRGRVTDRAPTTTVRASRTTPDPRTTPTGENAEAGSSEGPDGSKRRGSSEQRGRRTTCPSTPPLSRWSSHRDNSPSDQPPTPPRDHSAPLRYSLCCACCSAS